MTRIAVESELRYEVQSPSGLLFALSAAETASSTSPTSTSR